MLSAFGTITSLVAVCGCRMPCVCVCVCVERGGGVFQSVDGAVTVTPAATAADRAGTMEVSETARACVTAQACARFVIMTMSAGSKVSREGVRRIG